MLGGRKETPPGVIEGKKEGEGETFSLYPRRGKREGEEERGKGLFQRITSGSIKKEFVGGTPN